MSTVSNSPLWMVTNEPRLNQLVTHLLQIKQELMREPPPELELQFSKSNLEMVRVDFANMIRLGEERLHRLSQLLCHTFAPAFQLQSVVIGEVASSGERFTLIRDLSTGDLYSTTDIDLGTRQLNKLQFFDGAQWSSANLVANTVDYQPTTSNRYNIHRISSRIKAEEELWNKVVDEIFQLDTLVSRDKQLRHLSRYVKDVFGIKIVVGNSSDVRRVHQALVDLCWSDPQLKALKINPAPATRRLEFLETKDYLTAGKEKASGWAAIKSVVRWSEKTFEIQVQPLQNFLWERELLTRESHTSFKANRERVREQVARRIPLFGFYQDLLRWLFVNPGAPPPTHEGIRLYLVD